MLCELNHILKMLECVNNKIEGKVFYKNEIKHEEQAINDFYQLQENIQQKVFLLQQNKVDEGITTQAPLIDIHVQLGCCGTCIRHVQKLIKKLTSSLYQENQNAGDA